MISEGSDKIQKIIAATRAKPSGDGKWVGHCPAHPDGSPSLSIGKGDNGNVLVKCFAGCSQAAVIGALRDLGAWPAGDNGALRRPPGVPPAIDGKPFSHAWRYHDSTGKLLGYVCRFDDAVSKTIRPYFIRDGAKWRAGAAPIPRPLYNLHLLSARPDAGVIVCEGEKAADAAGRLLPGLTATTSPGGSGAASKANWRPLAGRDIRIWPDNDAPGEKYAAAVVRELQAVGVGSVRVLDVAGLAMPPKGDAADWPPGVPLPDPLPVLESPLRVSVGDDTEDEADAIQTPFERRPFPTEVFPSLIADSLGALAKSCACSFEPLPGAAFCLVGAGLGRTVSVSPKAGWDVPLIFWHIDLRASGEGKTAPVRMLALPIIAAQKRVQARYELALAEYQARKSQDTKQPPPAPERSYFVTGLTIEGLRAAVGTGHGGCVVIADELSSMITAANAYRNGRGDDREAWLNLWSGAPANVVRAKGQSFIEGSRVSVFGGIQPPVFQAVFDALRRSDGTLYRYLITCGPPVHHELTADPWGETNRRAWEGTLAAAMAWADRQSLDKPRRMILDGDAQSDFLTWRNRLDEMKLDLDDVLRGFLPKSVEYALRLTGAIACIHAFSIGREPPAMLRAEDFDRGRQVAEFYLGQTCAALVMLRDPTNQPAEVSARTEHLARVLAELEPQVDSGRLAIGLIHEQFNATCGRHQSISSPRAMGALLRSAGLSVSRGLHDANGRLRVHCLVWDAKAESLANKVSEVSEVSVLSNSNGPQSETLKTQCLGSLGSAIKSETSETLKNQSLAPGTGAVEPKRDIRDIRDMVCSADSKTEAFTKQSSQSSQSSQTNAWRALAGENIKNQCSQSSQVRGYGENFENIENQCSHPEPGVVEPHENIENVENMDSSTNPKAESADNGEPATENWVDDLERLEAVAYDKTPEPATCLGCKHLSEACFCSVKKEHRFTRQTGCVRFALGEEGVR